MKKLETNFRDGGFDFVIVEREGDVILAQYLREDGTPREDYIVFHVRKYDDRTIMGNFTPARESVPPAESWGDEGWSISSSRPVYSAPPKQTAIERAFDLFVKRVGIQKFSTLISDAPTGGKRGRVRDSFELDLTSFASSEFEFAMIENLNPEIESPMLRNRLKTEVDAGRVKVVRQITGGRGKPRNVYALA